MGNQSPVDKTLINCLSYDEKQPLWDSPSSNGLALTTWSFPTGLTVPTVPSGTQQDICVTCYLSVLGKLWP